MSDPWDFGDYDPEQFRNKRLSEMLYDAAFERTIFDDFPHEPMKPRPWYTRLWEWLDDNVAWRFARVRPDRDED